ELLEAMWQKLAPGVADAERRAEALTIEAADATRAAEAARVVVDRWDQRARLVARAEVLAKQGPEIDRARRRAELARKAAPVVAAATELDRARAGLDRADRVAARATAVLGGHLVDLELADPEEPVDPSAADTALGHATAELEQSVERVKALAAAVDEHQRAAAGALRLRREVDAHAEA